MNRLPNLKSLNNLRGATYRQLRFLLPGDQPQTHGSPKSPLMLRKVCFCGFVVPIRALSVIRSSSSALALPVSYTSPQTPDEATTKSTAGAAPPSSPPSPTRHRHSNLDIQQLAKRGYRSLFSVTHFAKDLSWYVHTSYNALLLPQPSSACDVVHTDPRCPTMQP